MKRYLITGGSGFIGTNLLNYIKANEPKAEVVVITVFVPDFPIGDCKYIVSSIEEIEKYEKFLDEDTSVIHLAWNGFPNNKMSNVVDGIHNNIVGSCMLFKVAIEHRCRSIVFLSTGGGIYGKPETIPITEKHPTVPLSYYGIEKLAVENYLRQMTRNTETKATVLRVANPYGKYQRPFIGQGVISTFLASILTDRPVQVWGDGSAVRDYLFIDDLSDAILLATHADDDFTIANIGSEIGTSINDIIYAVERVTEKKLLVQYVAATNAETGANILDCSLAHEKLHWKAKYSIDEGIKKMYLSWNPLSEKFDKKGSNQ